MTVSIEKITDITVAAGDVDVVIGTVEYFGYRSFDIIGIFYSALSIDEIDLIAKDENSIFISGNGLDLIKHWIGLKRKLIDLFIIPVGMKHIIRNDVGLDIADRWWIITSSVFQYIQRFIFRKFHIQNTV